MSVLYIGFENTLMSIGGGGTVTTRNLNFLKELYKDDLIIYRVRDRHSESFFSKILNDLINFSVGGIKGDDIFSISGLIEDGNVKLVYIDSSSMGILCKHLAMKYPNVKIIVYSHNIEFLLEYHLFKLSFNFVHLFKTVLNFYSEILVVKYSTAIFCTTKSDLLFYENKLKASCDLKIIPVSVSSDYKGYVPRRNDYSKYCLFVGSNFAPNKHGILWYIDYVLPKVTIDLIIVGKGMSVIESKIPEIYKNRIRIFDYVEDLSIFYGNCEFVIAPIFYGSGMKVKVAEAIFHNRPILLTTHAFNGYEAISSHYPLFVCNSDLEFIEGIDKISYLSELKGFGYEDSYTHDRVFDTFKKNIFDYD